jgi:hypothetical protein
MPRSREKEVELWMQDVAVQERLGGRVYNLARSYFHRFQSGFPKLSIDIKQGFLNYLIKKNQ